MPKTLSEAARFFQALADPVRLRIVRLLLKRPLCVCELTFILKAEQSRISHHLMILRDAGLVKGARQGRWMIYRIAGIGPRALAAALEPALRGDRDHFRAHRRDLAELDIAVQDDIRGQRCGPAEPAPRKRKNK